MVEMFSEISSLLPLYAYLLQPQTSKDNNSPAQRSETDEADLPSASLRNQQMMEETVLLT